METMLWHYIRDDAEYGPVDSEQMSQLIANGVVTADSMVWCEGMHEWQMAKQTVLAANFAPIPATVIPVATVVPSPAAKAKLRKQNLWSLAAMGWMFGAILIALGMQKGSRLEATAGKPNRLTLAELVTKGPGSNPYVELTNLRFGEQIWLEKDRNTDGWTQAWTFLFTDKDPINPVAVAHIDGGGEKAMSHWMSATTLRGLAEERPRFFTAYNGKKLFEMYPKATSRDLKWYIEVTNQRPSPVGVKLAYGSGVFLMIGGTVMAVIALRSRKANPTAHGIS